MRKKISLTLASLVLLLVVGLAFQSNRKRGWEYKVIFLTDDATITSKLNREGVEGWELVSFHMTSRPDRYGQGGLYYFKREK